METELKRTGQYEEYVRNLTTRGVKTYISELEGALLELALEDSNEEFVTEQGDVEKWAGKGIDKQKLAEEIQEYIQKLKDHVKD
jgi:predicted transcriptional regulator with HTH domain